MNRYLAVAVMLFVLTSIEVSAECVEGDCTNGQ